MSAVPSTCTQAPKKLSVKAQTETCGSRRMLWVFIAVSRVLTFIWPTLRKPVVWRESRRLSLPTHYEGTLVLEDAHALDAGDQRRLLEWLQAGTESLRLIATASPLLLALVEDGKFSRELYDHFVAVKLLLRGAADGHGQALLSTQTDARNASQRN